MASWRLLDTPPLAAADNMALDETLLELRGEGKSPDTIRFLQFSPRAVLVGYHQSVSEEIRLPYCREHGIHVNRRVTGGGAVFFDESQLGWEVVCAKSFFNVSIPDGRLFKTLCQPVVAALERLGIQADFRPRNDIEVGGRKISGTGGTDSGEAFLFQGTMLVDFDVDTMLKALRIPVEKLKAKEIDSVKERVTCLAWELGRVPPLEAIKEALRLGFEKHLGITLVPGELTEEERTRFREKRDDFASSRWIHQVSPRWRKRETVEAACKSEAGMARFTLAVDLPRRLGEGREASSSRFMKNARLKDVYITGDFLSFPSRALYDLEAELRGSPLDRALLRGIVRRYFQEGRMRIPGMDFEDFVRPLDLALEKVAIARFGIPLEHCNRISVTNGAFEDIVRKDLSVLLLPYCAKSTECHLRYRKGCRDCGEERCTVGPARRLGLQRNMKVISIVSFEDLWAELVKMKERGVEAYVGCCCRPFFAKHEEDFRKSRLPGILLDIDDTTCYDLDRAREAYAGEFRNQTALDLELLRTVLDAAAAPAPSFSQSDRNA